MVVVKVVGTLERRQVDSGRLRETQGDSNRLIPVKTQSVQTRIAIARRRVVLARVTHEYKPARTCSPITNLAVWDLRRAYSERIIQA